MAMTRSSAKKILLFYTLIQGVIVLILAASFAWITSRDASTILEVVTDYASSIALDKDGRDVFLADSPYALQTSMEKYKDIRFHFTSEF